MALILITFIVYIIYISFLSCLLYSIYSILNYRPRHNIMQKTRPHVWSTLTRPAWKPLCTTWRLQLPISMSGFPPNFTVHSFNWVFRLLFTLGPSHPICSILTRGIPSLDTVSVMPFSDLQLVHGPGKKRPDTCELSCHQRRSSTEHAYQTA
jgi:hypothetical protein